ncbi:homoserine O-acetyltransferase [Pelagibacteraceae bacterium]|mgnify:FL=1|nr:homoserine O-acetyltransferase [Pelagibacteraceae bacterium]MDB9742988.1 homoserine O-acetyltransferase [Pelagibacteraceae bacterium]MDC0339498.1 homoserine O-acetyltransferase [Pelagibacteraceae bacterium]MDC0366134.1 homoserine O-acetyltransferase [Pelagibacteraceae bacterium]
MNKKIEDIKKIIVSKPLKLDCGKTVKDFPLAYETYGKLSENRDNAILVFHALTGDQFVAGTNPVTNKEGWWITAVGPGKAIDTNKYFVICANVIGGCMGSWGPSNKNKETDQLYGLDFPVITIKDIIRAQESLLEYLGIKKLLCATGGSMGGMQLLQFCATFPDRSFSAIPIACSASHSAQNIALNELARQAIMADPVWDNGKYFLKNTQPKNGLAVARMVGHISYLSEQGMQERFGRKLQEKADYEFNFNADFQVESYLRHQGNSFVERFDANSILYITRAMDYFDLSKQFKEGLVEAFKNQKTKFLVISFSSDWLYTTKENKDIVIALNASGADVSYSEITTDKGHDSFLVDEPEFLKTLKGFIDSMYEKFKNEKRI